MKSYFPSRCHLTAHDQKEGKKDHFLNKNKLKHLLTRVLFLCII